MPKKIIIYWRDIPSQVVIKKGRQTGKVQLEHRFQEAIDRAAMRAGKGGSDAYIAEWRRETEALRECTDLQTTAAEIANELQQNYSDEMLDRLIKNHGSSEPS